MTGKRKSQKTHEDDTFNEHLTFLNNKAASMRWLFYYSADKKCFVLTYNHSVRPRHFSLQDKINLSPNDFVKMSYNGSSLMKLGTAAEVREAQRKTYQRLNDADKTLPFVELDKNIQAPVAQEVISSTQNAVFDDVLLDDVLMDEQSQARCQAHGKGKKKQHVAGSSFLAFGSLPQSTLEPTLFSQNNGISDLLLSELPKEDEVFPPNNHITGKSFEPVRGASFTSGSTPFASHGK